MSMLKINKIWPIAVIVLIWFVFSSPYFISGKIPFPSTYLATNFGPWNEYVSFSGLVKNTATPDVIGQIYPWKKLVIDIWKSGSIPLWNQYSFSGTPLLANYQSAALSPFNFIYFILPFVNAWSIQILFQPLLAGIFTYLFVRSLKLSNVASLVSAISFMFCGFITTWMAYGTLVYAILYLPLALFAIERFYETKKWYFTVLLTSSIPLSFFSGHFQTSLYFLLFTTAYILFKFATTRKIEQSLLSVISICTGLLICAPQLLPSIELYAQSVRSQLFMKTEVIPWTYFPTLLAPDIFGNPVTRNAWFGHYAEWNSYIGLIPLILAFNSFRKKNPYVIFFALGSIISILLAFQTPLLDLLVAARVPVLSTSAASRVIVIFSFSAAVLAAFGYENLMSDVKNKKFNKTTILCTAFLLTFGVLWTTILLKLFIPVEQIPTALSNLKLPTVFFGMFLIGFILSRLGKSKKIITIFGVLIILICAFDSYRFAAKWQPFDPKNLVYPDVPIQKVISGSNSYDRAFGSFGQELALTLRIGGLEGYDPLYIGRYGEFINAAPDGEYHTPERSVVNLSKNAVYTGRIINFLGVKYIIHKVADGRAIWAFPFWTYPVDQFQLTYADDKYQILTNNKAFKRAFVVSNYKKITDTREILQTIFLKDLDLSKTAVLEDNPIVPLSNDMLGDAVIKSYESNRVSIQTTTKNRALLVLTDPFYSGWEAFVDGKPTKIYRADYTFRGVIVPEGQHLITFTYYPSSFKIGLTLAVLGALGTVSVAMYLWKKKSQYS